MITQGAFISQLQVARTLLFSGLLRLSRHSGLQGGLVRDEWC